MPQTIGWGILGPGGIAKSFAADLAKAPDAALVAVGSRSRRRAEAFADQFDVRRAYDDYAALMADPDVDVIYIATPHPFHHAQTIACLARGKAVLCEKPLAVNARQVQEMIDCAAANGRFLMEAMWTRFLPVIETVRTWLAAGRIGEVRMMAADFGFAASWAPDHRLFAPELAGGALLDVGVYAVALAAMVFGGPPRHIQAAASLGETGVDEQTAMLFAYEGGALAQLFCAIRTETPNEAWIAGTKGRIHLPTFWHPTEATLMVAGEPPVQATGEEGYHFQAIAVMDALRAGSLACEKMSWTESLHIAQTMDAVRERIGVKYPMEGEKDGE